jgi:hypothetical protein
VPLGMRLLRGLIMNSCYGANFEISISWN